MDNAWAEAGWALPAGDTAIKFVSRLAAAAVLGGLVGWERERRGRAAGLRTHMLVALGAALFTLAALETGATGSDVAHLVKGIAAGIGFLGAGAILKLADAGEIRGLTTAASIWLTAAVGMAAGLGHIWMGLTAVAFSLVILLVIGRFEARGAIAQSQDAQDDLT